MIDLKIDEIDGFDVERSQHTRNLDLKGNLMSLCGIISMESPAKSDALNTKPLHETQPPVATPAAISSITSLPCLLLLILFIVGMLNCQAPNVKIITDCCDYIVLNNVSVHSLLLWVY